MMATSTLPAPIARRPEFAGILRDEVTYAAGGRDNVADRVNGAFDRLMLQSGLDIGPPMMLALSVCSAALFGGAAFVVQENLLTTALAAAIGGMVPILATLVTRSRRQRAMMRQLPDAIDELARAARTGRSVEDCLRLVAAETPAPLGDELKRCTRKMTLGVDIETALKDLPLRTGLTNLHVVVCALAVHNETGGDLVAVLERVARAVRDRIAFLGRLRAATIGSRATATLMLVLPPAALAFFMFRDSTYLDQLFDSFWGRAVTVGAVLLQAVGLLWVIQIFRTSERA
jgi:tight adherence protein B